MRTFSKRLNYYHTANLYDLKCLTKSYKTFMCIFIVYGHYKLLRRKWLIQPVSVLSHLVKTFILS
jgi:hypothetical protein